MSPSLVKVRLTVKSCRTMLNKLRIVEATIILDVKIIDEHEWDEKAMLNIVVEVDVENDGDEGVMDWSTTASASASAGNNSNGAAQEHRGRREMMLSAPFLLFDILDPQNIDGGPSASAFFVLH